MTERWGEIKLVFGAALERPPQERVAYLDATCAGDPDLRREVESLLAAHQQSDTFLDAPAPRISPSLTPVSPAFATGQTVGTYRVLRTLGHGGMATVYLAQDLRHRRSVALKVLHPDLAHAVGADRFLREIEVAANLSHPHILPLFDSGEAQGLLYYVMPYVEGESLRERLRRETQLGIEDALRLACEIADALEYAHSQGVVHRDIKPENILLSRGHALVADFGIARVVGEAGAERLTKTGMAVGTAAYMSPEQASGASQIDGRTDVYSLGCVLYEMLAGEPPYTGPTAQAVIAKRFTDPIPSVSRLRPSVPAAVDQILTKALATVPADRFATAADFLRTLAASASNATRTGHAVLARATAVRRTGLFLAMGLAAALALVLAASAILRQRIRQREAPSATTRLAVLPFENLGNPNDEYFADGMADAVRGKLAGLPGVQVTARSSSVTYKKTGKTPRQIGRELGVQYLLAGTVRWERGSGGSSRVQVRPELIQVSTASATWAQPFDAVLNDVFQVQTDISGRVAQALDLALGPGDRKTLADRPTTSLDAYDAYLKGEKLVNGMSVTDATTLRQALVFYEQATVLDPSFLLAWVQLSRTHSFIYSNSVPTWADADAARIAAERALALAPNRAETYLALGDYYSIVSRDYPRALVEYQRGQRLAPDNADLLTSPTLMAERALGQWDSAYSHLQRAFTLDPRSAFTAQQLGFVSLWLRRYAEALAAHARALALAPDNLQTLESAAMVRLAQGNLAGARAVIHAAPAEVDATALVSTFGSIWDLYWVLDDAQQQLLLRLRPTAFDDDRGAWGIVLAQTYGLRGDRAKARAYADSARIAFEEQLEAAPQDAQRHLFLGLALAYLDKKAEAVREGERVVASVPAAKDGANGAYYQHQLVRIYLLVGEPEKALDNLEPLLRMPYYLSPGWLKIDPTFAPLRGNPRFERLVNGA